MIHAPVRSAFLRLRQICLVAPTLAPAVEQVRRVFGVEICHRDEAVAKHGLVNALFVFGHQFLEIIAPAREGTAAGRFLVRSGGRGGYMVIFDTDDPPRRQAHAEALGVRIAHRMDAPGFHGIQLHPRDTRAAMLEFDRSAGNEHLDGAYAPAGAHWHAHRRPDLVAGIPWVDVETPDPEDLGAHWARIIDVALERDRLGHPVLRFELGAVRFVVGAAQTPERLVTLHVEVGDPVAVRASAVAEALPSDGEGFLLSGVRFVPHLPATRT